jgi:hypothetical protein
MPPARTGAAEPLADITTVGNGVREAADRTDLSIPAGLYQLKLLKRANRWQIFSTAQSPVPALKLDIQAYQVMYFLGTVYGCISVGHADDGR